MPTEEKISLREFVESRFAAFQREHDIQATELSRRLDELNHAHAKSVEDKAQFLPREVFDQSQREERSWREQVNNTLAEAKGRATILAAIMSIAVGIVVLVISKVWK